MLDVVLKARRQDQCDAIYRYLREGQFDREDCDSFVTPLSSYFTSWISGRDSCSVGVSCHSPRNLVISGIASMHHFQHLLILKWGQINPSSKWNTTRVKLNLFHLPKMAFRKVHQFWNGWKLLPKMMHTFLGHFWILELIHTYLNLDN